MSTPNGQRGLSLVETMISLGIGLLLVSSLITVFVAGNRNYRQDVEFARMQESARFAMKTLADEVAMMGFLGESLTPVPGGASATADCGPGGGNWALDLGRTIDIQVDADGAAANAAFGCIEADNFVDGTDIFAVKRVEGLPVPTADLGAEDVNEVFVTSSSSSGSLAVYSGDNFEASKNNWRYLARIYYIRNESLLGSDDGMPTLHRKSLGNHSGSDLTVADVDGGIARGIEYFHIEFGIDSEVLDDNPDTEPDGAPNYYIANPSTGELAAAVTARIYVLARSRSEITGYQNDKIYTMGDVTRDYSGVDDNFYRQVFSTTIRLRNMHSRAYMQHIVNKV